MQAILCVYQIVATFCCLFPWLDINQFFNVGELNFYSLELAF